MNNDKLKNIIQLQQKEIKNLNLAMKTMDQIITIHMQAIDARDMLIEMLRKQIKAMGEREFNKTMDITNMRN